MILKIASLFGLGVRLTPREVLLSKPDDLCDIDLKYNIPLVRLSVNDMTYNFILDTGSAQSWVFRGSNLLKINPERLLPSKYIETVLLGKVGVSRIKRFKFLNCTVSDIDFLIYDNPFPDHSKFRPDGIIGINLLSNNFLNLRLSASRAEFSTTWQGGTEYGLKLPLGAPEIQLTVDGTDLDFLIDTGASNSGISLGIEKGKEIKRSVVTYGIEGKKHDGEVSFISMEICIADELKKFEFMANQEIAKLGINVLQDYNIQLDLTNQLVKFENVS